MFPHGSVDCSADADPWPVYHGAPLGRDEAGGPVIIQVSGLVAYKVNSLVDFCL